MKTPSSDSKKMFYLAIVAVALTIIVIGVGSYTRLVHAGLGCPDWPGCYGLVKSPSTDAEITLAAQNFPGMEISSKKGWVEMFHRYIAGILLLLITYIAIASWRNKQQKTNHILATGILIFTLLQAAFGMWTVTLKLWPQVVVAHLLGGMLLSSLLLYFSLREYYQQPLIITNKIEITKLYVLKCIATLALFIVFIQIAIGGWTSANYASLACSDFPTCQGVFLPYMDFKSGFNLFLPLGENYLGGKLDSTARTAIHVIHRFTAVVVFIVVSILIYQSKKNISYLRGWHNTFNNLLTVIFIIMVLQIALGIINIISHLPLMVAVAHTVIASLLLLSLVTYNFYIRLLINNMQAN